LKQSGLGGILPPGMTIDIRKLLITVVVVWLVVTLAFVILGLAVGDEEETSLAALRLL
jgi:hypothetical protein